MRVTVDRLVGRIAHWTPSRWKLPTASGASRADVVHGLVQEIADLGADAEGRPRRPVPRLDNDLVLPDQLRVVTADLLAAARDPAVLAGAADRVTAVGRALS